MYLVELQYRVEEWSSRNFGSDPAHRLHPLLGMSEELGELAGVCRSREVSDDAAVSCVEGLLELQEMVGALAHAVLKGIQGIRGGSMARVCVLDHVLVGLVGEMTRVLGENGVARTFPGADEFVNQTDRIDAIGDIQIYMADFCRRNEINLADAVCETWGKVSKRDWKAHPETGEEMAA